MIYTGGEQSPLPPATVFTVAVSTGHGGVLPLSEGRVHRCFFGLGELLFYFLVHLLLDRLLLGAVGHHADGLPGDAGAVQLLAAAVFLLLGGRLEPEALEVHLVDRTGVLEELAPVLRVGLKQHAALGVLAYLPGVGVLVLLEVHLVEELLAVRLAFGVVVGDDYHQPYVRVGGKESLAFFVLHVVRSRVVRVVAVIEGGLLDLEEGAGENDYLVLYLAGIGERANRHCIHLPYSWCGTVVWHTLTGAPVYVGPYAPWVLTRVLG